MELKKLLTLSLFVPSIVLVAPVNATDKEVPPTLFDDIGITQQPGKKLPKKAVEGRNRTVNAHIDLLGSDSLTLNLFDDVVVTAVRDRLVDKVKGSTTWIGHVEGEPESEVFLTVRGKTLSGTVQVGGDTYEIEFKGGKYDITQVDPDKNPEHSQSKTVEEFLATGGQVSTGPTTNTSPTTSAATAGTVIDLMVAYTPKAKANASGQAGIEAKIANAVAKANQAYINSQIDMQLNLVAMVETNYAETGNMSTSLTDLTGTSDGKMDEVHTLRNQYGADQVALVTADTNYCGIAYVMTSVSTAFAPYAFSVVHDDSVYACLSDNTLAHELGHNQGDQHDRANSTNPGAYDYSYGYRLCQTGGFRTVMSYSCTGATRVSYFSNPNVQLSTGEVTGTATENNSLSMTNTKATVAAFRSTAVLVPNAPSNLGATALSDSQISLTWTDNSSNETGFRLERSVDGVNWTEFAVTNSNTVSFTDTGLAASTTYQYRARAYNSAGNSNYSNVGSATTTSAVCTANSPALSMQAGSLYSKPSAAIGFNISLTNQDTAACGASTFALTGSDGTALGSYTLSPAGSAATTWTATAPATDGNYTASVTASEAGHANAAASATVLVDGTAPTAPGNLSASIVKRTQVALSWSASTDAGSGVSYYVVKRNNVVIATTTGTKYTDKPGTKGTFTYTVEAVDKAGNAQGSSKSITL